MAVELFKYLTIQIAEFISHVKLILNLPKTTLFYHIIPSIEDVNLELPSSLRQYVPFSLGTILVQLELVAMF